MAPDEQRTFDRLFPATKTWRRINEAGPELGGGLSPELRRKWIDVSTRQHGRTSLFQIYPTLTDALRDPRGNGVILTWPSGPQNHEGVIYTGQVPDVESNVFLWWQPKSTTTPDVEFLAQALRVDAGGPLRVLLRATEASEATAYFTYTNTLGIQDVKFAPASLRVPTSTTMIEKVEPFQSAAGCLGASPDFASIACSTDELAQSTSSSTSGLIIGRYVDGSGVIWLLVQLQARSTNDLIANIGCTKTGNHLGDSLVRPYYCANVESFTNEVNYVGWIKADVAHQPQNSEAGLVR